MALLAAAPSCGVGAFACTDDDACVRGSTQGVCTPAGACAFPDAACSSGLRYGDHAGARSGECVPPDAGGSETGVADTGGSSTGRPTTSGGVDATALSVDDASASMDGSSSGHAGTASSGDPGSTTGPAVDPDLLIWLRFDAVVDEGVANDGVLGGTAMCSGTCPTVDAGLARFDGVGTCLQVPHEDALAPAAWTMAAWVRPSAVANTYFLFGKAFGAMSENCWEFYVDGVGDLRALALEVIVENVIQAPPPTNDAWTHVAAAFDGTVLSLWIAGELQGELPVQDIAYDEHPVRFGCDSDDGAEMYFFDGWLADVRFYGRALEGDELAALASAVPGDP